MNTFKFAAQVIFLTTVSFQVQAYDGPPVAAAFKDANWSAYCGGPNGKIKAVPQGSEDIQIPEPNYQNPDVKEAAAVLNRTAKESNGFSFYFYSGPKNAYGLKSFTPPAGIEKDTHIFLTILCGEFRDRPSMVKAKLNWVKNLYLLPGEAPAQNRSVDMSKNLWAQMSAHDYGPYLQFSRALWAARKGAMKPKSASGSCPEMNCNVGFGGKYPQIDGRVDGQTVCVTKHVFNDYIFKGKTFPGLEAFNSSYTKFESSCSQDDKDHYYDFRGDSNFKPNSPEGNGMIWYSSSVAKFCKDPNTATNPDVDCQAYFRRPFYNRWMSARAGLATWMFRDRTHDPRFSSEGDSVMILQRQFKDLTQGLAPLSFKYEASGNKIEDYLKNWDSKTEMLLGDMGFNRLVGLGSGNANWANTSDAEFAYERLRDAVNRHTDWYASAYDDGFGMVRDQAYSPFVASSYEMSASDTFTAPGTTVNSPSDGRKHWMFVFKIHKDNWYSTNSLAKGDPVNFDTQWFDETSLGTNGLAKSEHAWDRMGTAIEPEYDSILYLHNISTSGQVVGKN